MVKVPIYGWWTPPEAAQIGSEISRIGNLLVQLEYDYKLHGNSFSSSWQGNQCNLYMADYYEEAKKLREYYEEIQSISKEIKNKKYWRLLRYKEII